MPVIDDKKNLLIKCTCHYHVLEIEYDDYDDVANFNVSVWNQTPHPITILDRLKVIWKMICGKTLDGGDVIIEKSDARAIVNFLNKHLGESKNGKQKSKKTDTTRRSS